MTWDNYPFAKAIVSTDSGKTWSPIFTGDIGTSFNTFKPQTNNVIYAGGYEDYTQNNFFTYTPPTQIKVSPEVKNDQGLYQDLPPGTTITYNYGLCYYATSTTKTCTDNKYIGTQIPTTHNPAVTGSYILKPGANTTIKDNLGTEYTLGTSTTEKRTLSANNTIEFIVNLTKKPPVDTITIKALMPDGSEYKGKLGVKLQFCDVACSSANNFRDMATQPDAVPYTITSGQLTYKVIPFRDGPKGYIFDRSILNQTFNKVSGVPLTITIKFTKQVTPILFIPGVYGSELRDGSNELVWLNACGAVLPDPTSYDDLDEIKYSTSLQSIRNDIKATDIIRKPSCGLSFNYGSAISEFYKNQGYLENGSLFYFFYDWRDGVSYIDNSGISNQNIVGKLSSFIQGDYIYGSPIGTRKINVIAHSTGGLILKKYLQLNPGKDPSGVPNSKVDSAIFIGVPHDGAPLALYVMMTGNTGLKNLYFRDSEVQTLAQNLPIVFDLAPSVHYLNKDNVFQVRSCTILLSCTNWTNVSLSNAWIYLTSHFTMNSLGFDLAKSRHQSLDGIDVSTSVNKLYSFIGCGVETPAQVGHSNVDGLPDQYFRFVFNSGDGTVPTYSSEQDGSRTIRYYVHGVDHGSLPAYGTVTKSMFDLLTTGKLTKTTTVNQTTTDCSLTTKAIEVSGEATLALTSQNGEMMSIASAETTEQNQPTVTGSISGVNVQSYGKTFVVFYDQTTNLTSTLTSQQDHKSQIHVQSIENNSIKEELEYDKVPKAVKAKLPLTAQEALTLKSKQPKSSSTLLIPEKIKN